MTVSFAHPCPVCGKDQYGEVCRDCVFGNLAKLPHPATMTPDQRYAEMLQYQNYPAGWPLDALQDRVEALIGRKLRRASAPADMTDSIALSHWLTENEHTPNWTDVKGWTRLADEAHDAYQLLTSGEEVQN